MTDVELARFLEDPKYADILKKAVEVEEQLDNDQSYARQGWEWHEVQGYPLTLVRLLLAGILKVAYRSNDRTMYLLVDRQAVKKALG